MPQLQSNGSKQQVGKKVEFISPGELLKYEDECRPINLMEVKFQSLHIILESLHRTT